MKMCVKLALGFSVSVLILLLAIAFCLNIGVKIHGEFEILKEDIVPGAIAMGSMDGTCQQIAHDLMDYMVAAGEEEEEEAVRVGLSLLTKASSEHIEHETHIGEEEKKEAGELTARVERFASAAAEIINLKKEGAGVKELLKREEEILHPALETLVEQLAYHKATHVEELSEAEQAVHRAHVLGGQIALLASVLAVSLTAMVAFITTRSITKPLNALCKGTEMIGSGNLDYKVGTNVKDEIGELSRAFDKMTGNLKKATVSRDVLNAANQQLGANNQQLEAGQQQLRAANQRLESEITERKVVERQLRRVQTAVDNAYDAIVIIDKHGKAIYANTAFGNLFDCTVESINKADLNSIFVDKKVAIEAYRVALLGDFWTGRTEMVSVNGRSFPALLRCTPLMDNGSNISGTLLIVSDITELKEAENRQAQLLKKVESVNNELKDFAYIVSHDLKTPLRGISTLAHWISDDYADKLGEDGKEQMELLLSRVGRMHDLIEGILQYSRVGRMREKLVEVELGELVPEVIDNVAAPENISITIEDELPAIVCGHTRIMQVFQNLLSNAVEYMDKPAGQIRIGCVDEGDCWKFSVTDNGPGIEERHFERIFKVFQTVSDKDGYESTGVGLSVVKKIVEMYGGKIWVESEVGKGSSFFFTLAKPERRDADAKLEANIAY